ncbi:putative multi-domain containing protein [Aduncisulcus paluster]|uniref:Multi-domain containing protein n=1 Tax=Aduncisulcus paluster TaxID=2918883 RepID=A0ABQ5JW36_9EUKA|nr:putative multi-domain containing protein [Aduncisulcus paluster]
MSTLLKSLRGLESRKFVKRFTPIHGNRKMYIQADLIPDPQISGGVWYDGKDFDKEFINILMKITERYVKLKGFAQSGEISEYISSAGVCKTTLRETEINTLLNAMVYDGRLLKVQEESKRREVFTVPMTETSDGRKAGYIGGFLSATPCAGCPRAASCHPGNVSTNPQSCLYIKAWIGGKDFFDIEDGDK